MESWVQGAQKGFGGGEVLGWFFFSGVKVKNDLHNRNYSLKHVVIHVHDSLLASESTLLESA